MNRSDLSPDTLLAIAPMVLHSLGYSVTWGSAANAVASVDAIDAALGGPGRY